MLDVQLISDLHIEVNSSQEKSVCFEVRGDILILAGDIGSFYQLDALIKFLDEVCESYRHVLYVIGNHEYYTLKGQKYYEPMDTLRWKFGNRVRHLKNLHILDRKAVRIGNTVFAGATLWSHIPLKEKMPYFIRSRLGLSKKKYNKLHQRDNKWIERMIRETSEKASEKENNLVIITHHSPTYKSLKKVDNYSYMYASSMDSLIHNSNMTTWIHGHTHHNMDYELHGVRIVTNQLGKKYDSCTLDPAFLIEF
jgi:Icc-related predicted phosphoesterase